MGETIDLRNSNDKFVQILPDTYIMKIILRNLMAKNKVVHLRPWSHAVCSAQRSVWHSRLNIYQIGMFFHVLS